MVFDAENCLLGMWSQLTRKRDPLANSGTVIQLVDIVQKTACLQMMYDGKLQLHQESLMMMPIDPRG